MFRFIERGVVYTVGFCAIGHNSEDRETAFGVGREPIVADLGFCKVFHLAPLALAMASRAFVAITDLG